MRYEFGENTVKSKLWEVMLRQVHVKGARIVEKIEQHMTRNVALFIKNMWFNKQMKYNQYINALWQYRRKTYNLYGMPIDLFEYMYDFLTYDDSNQFDKTSNFIKYRLIPNEKHGYIPYLWTMQYGSDFLFKLQNAIGLKELCKRIVFNKYTLPYPDAKSLYDELQGSLPIYVLNSGKHIWNGDIFGNIVQYMDFQSLIQSSYVCRDWLRFIMTNTTLSKAPGSQCVEINDEKLDKYDEYYSGDYLISGASHYVWSCCDADYDFYHKPRLVGSNVFVYEGTHMQLDKYPDNLQVLKYVWDTSINGYNYGIHDNYWQFATCIGNRIMAIYCIDGDDTGRGVQINECLLLSMRNSQLCENELCVYIEKDICQYFYFKSPKWAWAGVASTVNGLNERSPNKHLYILDSGPCTRMLHFLVYGQIVETLFKHFFWSMRLEHSSGVKQVFDFLLNLPSSSPLKTIEILFIAKRSYHMVPWNDNGQQSIALLEWIYKNWEQIANNQRIKSWKIGLVKVTHPKSGILHDIKNWFNDQDCTNFQNEWHLCLHSFNQMQSSPLYELWKSIHTPWFKVLNDTLQK